MATIIAEDGTGLANSNSYATEAELTTYATDRGITIAGTTAVLLIQAMDYLEQKGFIGTKGSEAQALQWPRWGALLDGYYIETTDIPVLLKESQMEFALGIDGGTNPLSNQDRETTREKVGDIEVEYSGSARAVTYITAGETKISKLVRRITGAFRG